MTSSDIKTCTQSIEEDNLKKRIICLLTIGRLLLALEHVLKQITCRPKPIMIDDVAKSIARNLNRYTKRQQPDEH